MRPYQVFAGVLTQLAVDGYGESGFGSAEKVLKTAFTSKEGSRREIYPMAFLAELVKERSRLHCVVGREVSLDRIQVKLR